MQFALVEMERREAEPSLSGVCPGCGKAMIAKCGQYRVHHWAHQGGQSCDPWWESETEWHRAWKNNFPAACLEYFQHDRPSGERHIADVRTPHGLVIEFQHSHLKPLERAARERFYGNMVWVVDGTRLKRDYPRFNEGKNNLRHTPMPGYFLLAFPKECFPAMWLESSVPVIFDFRCVDQSQPPDAYRDGLWCLLPGRVEGKGVVVGMSREDFVKVAPSRPQLLAVRETLQFMTELLQRRRVKRDTLLEYLVEGDRGGDIRVFELIEQFRLLAQRGP
jgi:competence protein CoiA